MIAKANEMIMTESRRSIEETKKARKWLLMILILYYY